MRRATEPRGEPKFISVIRLLNSDDIREVQDGIRALEERKASCGISRGERRVLVRAKWAIRAARKQDE